ncbi:MAG: kynureninase [Phycisphaeraceae bacterium]|nr:MAG: kynureninase [Phycisphaeraceae bacterium]
MTPAPSPPAPPASPAPAFDDASEDFARHRDAADPLATFRERFLIPRRPDGSDVIYLCGNSLGLQPKHARTLVMEELDDWASLAVEAHFEGRRPWYPYHEVVRGGLARLVGAREHEVVAMNSLTVNLHLMMVSFYRPTRQRFRVLMESPAFPSDTYAVCSHVACRGFDPRDAVIEVSPRPGEHLIREDDIEQVLRERGDSIALVLLGGVNFLSGQVLDMPRLTRAAHHAGAMIGFDLAHAVGNVPLALHEWDVDFACWCSYKYLNSGPGAVAGCFIHERHARDVTLPRYGGWWGNDPATRFRMHLEHEFRPVPTADGWQLSNPPILALAPVKASLDLFDEAGMAALRVKSDGLTPYLRWLIERERPEWFEVITPRETVARGCQLSILVHDRPRERFKALTSAGVVCDFREPNVIRVAPAPLYNTFLDAWRFARALTELR